MERLSGATTDLQHIVHQGMSYYGATFWVGANAVIRKRALDDIVEVEHQGGFEIRRYIMDRTVIEDTESSVDLAHPRLAAAQLPGAAQLSRHAAGLRLSVHPATSLGQWRTADPAEAVDAADRSAQARRERQLDPDVAAGQLHGLDLLEQHRVAAPAVLPVRQPAAQPAGPVGRGAVLHRDVLGPASGCGYKRTDIFRIYGFNLILLPVNLAGVVKSLQQAITGRQIPFARTPKVANRTATSFLFAISPFLIIGFSVFTVWRDFYLQNWGNAAFAGFNAITATYALVSLMGVRNALVDIWLGFVERLYVPDKSARRRQSVQVRGRKIEPEPVQPSWQDVLYRGAAATATGEHVSESTGMFRILAQPPEPPVQHNRRATDRIRASDRIDGPGLRASDRMDGMGMRAGDRVDSPGRRAADRGDGVGSRSTDRVEISVERTSDQS